MNLWKANKRAFAPEDETGGGAPEAQEAEGGAAPAEGDEASTGPDFSFIPEDFRKDGAVDADGFKTYLEDLTASKGRLDEMMADVPEDAEGYEFQIPDDIDYKAMGLPETFGLQISADDPVLSPLLKDLGGVMHQYGMPKSAAKDLMGVLARYEATSYKTAADSMKADLQSLGPKSDARVAAVRRAIEAKLPEDLAKGLLSSVTSAAGVKALEKLMGGSGTTTPATAQPKTVEDDLHDFYGKTA